MAIKITPKFNRSDIQRMLEQRKQMLGEVILSRLQLIGEQFVIDAREQRTYQDRTGNLRSSIGYIILRDGEQIEENFASKDGPEGEDRAKEVAAEVGAKFATGFVLIGVAGMHYAAYVESKGFNVITSSAVGAKESLEKAVQQIQNKLGKVPLR